MRSGPENVFTSLCDSVLPKEETGCATADASVVSIRVWGGSIMGRVNVKSAHVSMYCGPPRGPCT